MGPTIVLGMFGKTYLSSAKVAPGWCATTFRIYYALVFDDTHTY
jgi:Na+(H+)/acetate symporter ActP